MTKQKAEPYPVYFLYGAENYLIDEEVQGLMDRCLSQKERGLNLHLFSGEEHGGQEIVQTAQTLPMFSRYRFVLVSEADRIEKKKVEIFLRYIENPSLTTCLVLCAQTPGPWKEHLTEIEKMGKVKEYHRLRGMALVSWMRKRMLEKGKALTDDAADYLVEVVGDHLHDVENTLEKVFLSVGEKKRIELSDVEGIASQIRISTVFDLTDAIGHQNLEKSLGILQKALESKTISFKKEEETSRKMDDPIPLLLSMIAKQYWGILGVKKMTSGQLDTGEVAKALKMSPWNVKKLMDQGKNFSESSLREGMIKCHQTDLSIKKGQGPKDLLMEKLVIDLCRPVEK
ncbi:MAG: DNA polymerase III subunit delta [Thermodesulfobacteriota bacterium]|jgi:DNA polymerase-3 subunit delta